MSSHCRVKPSLRGPVVLTTFFFAVLVLLLIVMVGTPGFEGAWRITVLLGVGVLWYAYTSSLYSEYVVTEHDIRGVSGVFIRKSTRVPLQSITNVDIQETLFCRLLGVTHIYIDTPAGPSRSLRIRSLDLRSADLVISTIERKMARQGAAARNRIPSGQGSPLQAPYPPKINPAKMTSPTYA